MSGTPIFAWEGVEYSFNEKNADWYWALGIVTFAAVVAAILFSNLLLAAVIAAAGAAVALQAAKHPRLHHFQILDTGVAIDNSLYLYSDMYDFSILEYLDPSLPLALSIKTRHILAPHLLIPINDQDPDEVYEYLAQQLPEGEHADSFVDRLAHLLRFY